MARAQVAKLAGSALKQYFDELLKVSGDVGTKATQKILKLGTNTFMPGATGKAIPEFLRSSATSITPRAGGVAAKTFVIGSGLAGTAEVVDKMMGQQSQHSQPIKKGTSGDIGMDQFLLQQQLQNQKFQLDMALVQAKNAALVPRNQPQSAENLLRLAEAEKTMTEAGELTNKEVQGIARMIFGTGFRA